MIKNDTYYVPTSVDSINQSSRQVISSAQQKRDVIKQYKCHMVNGVDGHFGIRKTTSAVQAQLSPQSLRYTPSDTCDGQLQRWYEHWVDASNRGGMNTEWTPVKDSYNNPVHIIINIDNIPM